MAATASHPKLATVRWDRKAGRYDYNRFDDVSSGAACVGYKSIGKVNVDCSFLFKKSRWGVLGDAQSPAGIIYMDINFDQPRDCKLESATIQVTLEQKGPFHPKPASSGAFDSMPSKRPVQLTQWYGPKHISGMPRKMLVKETMHLTPNFNILGNGGGGVGIDRERAFEHTSNWTFTGSLQPDEGDRSATYKTLKWVLEENELAKYPVHSNKIHTAFAFESNGEPFLMKVHISGRLKNMVSRLRLKMKPGPKDIPSTWIGYHPTYKRPLDELAKGLERAMELDNYNSVPLELPEAQAATFRPAQQVPDHGDAILQGEDGATDALPAPAQAMPNQPQIRIENVEPSGLIAERAAGRLEETVDPTLEALARFGGSSYAYTPIRRPPTPRLEDFGEDRSEASSLSSRTLVNSQAGEEDDGDEATSQGDGPRKAAGTADIDQEMVARLMELTVVRLLVQFMILLGFLGPALGSTKEGNDEGDDAGDSNTRQAGTEKGLRQRLSPPQRRLDAQRRPSSDRRATPRAGVQMLVSQAEAA